ncbi:hypothetical protein BDW68DRAFT_18200 [Aspergillus falconensis]
MIEKREPNLAALTVSRKEREGARDARSKGWWPTEAEVSCPRRSQAPSQWRGARGEGGWNLDPVCTLLQNQTVDRNAGQIFFCKPAAAVVRKERPPIAGAGAVDRVLRWSQLSRRQRGPVILDGQADDRLRVVQSRKMGSEADLKIQREKRPRVADDDVVSLLSALLISHMNGRYIKEGLGI